MARPPTRTELAVYTAIVMTQYAGISYVFLNVFIAIGGQSVFLLLATSAVKIP
jgi:hypothetical protein